MCGEISIAESAYAHGATEPNIRRAYAKHSWVTKPYGNPPIRRYTISRDQSDNWLELVIINYETDSAQIIHVMPPTTARRREFRRYLR